MQPMLYGIAALPQDPRCLLVGETVEEDLREMQADPQEEQALIERLELKELLQHHPYDLRRGAAEACLRESFVDKTISSAAG